MGLKNFQRHWVLISDPDYSGDSDVSDCESEMNTKESDVIDSSVVESNNDFFRSILNYYYFVWNSG